MTVIFLLLIPEQDKHTVVGGFFKNEGRYIYQLGLFLITVNLILWPIYVLRNDDDISKLFRIVFYSVAVLSILGLFQELSIMFFNNDPFPIHRPEGFDYEGGSLVIPKGETIRRINSLAGEPKHLAIALIIGMVVILLHRLNGKNIIRFDLFFFTLFLACLVLTYSTTGYIWYGVVMFLLMMLYGFKLSRNIMALLIAASITMAVVHYSTGGEPTPYIMKTINKTGLEVQDEAVLNFLLNEPYYAITGLGLGNVHFYADKYLPPGLPIFRDTPFKGNTGLLFLLGDTGFIGLLILFLFISGLIKSTTRNLSRTFNKTILTDNKIIIHLTIILLALFALRYFEFFFVVLGCLLFVNNQYNSKKTIPST